MSSRLIVGPFNRVEGSLEVQLSIDQGRVTEAWVNANLFRGFEGMLLGKTASDLLVYAPRICGICSISQSVAAAYSLASVYHARMPNNGRIATNLLLAVENAADHLTSFYLFFMPDFTREVYRDQPWYPEVVSRFKAGSSHYLATVMQMRANWLSIMGILAGKWPHSLSIRSTGTTKSLTMSELIQLKQTIQQTKLWLEHNLIGCPKETFLSLTSPEMLWRWADTHAESRADLPLFMRIATSLSLCHLGKGNHRLMSYGSYLTEDHHNRYFTSGTYHQGHKYELNTQQITEDVSHAHYHAHDPYTPWQETLRPELDKEEAYSWCKAPRLAGEVIEVGALARQVVHGQPLVRALFDLYGSTVFTRVFARIFELITIIDLVDTWVSEIEIGAPFCSTETIKDGRGVGFVEAARGSLGHWVEIEKGKIKQFQVIAPTTWNFSPRDHQGIAGALEQALVGAPCYDGESSDPASVQHIVRSFDPCMACTVH